MNGREKSVARVQIAGVHDAEEARTVAHAGAGWIGLPLRLDVHDEDMTETQAKHMIRECRDLAVTFVLITYLEKAEDVAELARFLDVTHVQVHGQISVNQLRKLKAMMPQAFVIKSLVLRADNEMELRFEVRRYSRCVNAFITDTYDPRTGASGATGQTHDWTVSRRLVQLSPKPVILAGGLTPENVGGAIRIVRPAGVDAHTGVENPDGRKNPAKVEAFVSAATEAFESPTSDL